MHALDDSVTFHDPEVLALIKVVVWLGVCGCLIHAFKVQVPV